MEKTPDSCITIPKISDLQLEMMPITIKKISTIQEEMTPNSQVFDKYHEFTKKLDNIKEDIEGMYSKLDKYESKNNQQKIWFIIDNLRISYNDLMSKFKYRYEAQDFSDQQIGVLRQSCRIIKVFFNKLENLFEKKY